MFPQQLYFFLLILFVVSSQFGNTCYCNSVLQALYFCRPFREKVLAYKPVSKRKESLLTCLADLFNNIASQKKKVGVIAPKKFVARLRKENGRSEGYSSFILSLICIREVGRYTLSLFLI